MAADTTFPYAADATALADQVREQFFATVKQGNELALNAVTSWTKAVAAVPVPELPEIPGALKVSDFTDATKYSFDFAIELLNTQREFALQLVDAMTPAHTA